MAKIDRKKFIELYPLKTTAQLAKMFKVSPAAIRKTAARLGVKKSDVDKRVKKEVSKRVFLSANQMFKDGLNLYRENATVVADTKTIVEGLKHEIEKEGAMTPYHRSEMLKVLTAQGFALDRMTNFLKVFYDRSEAMVFFESLREVYDDIPLPVQRRFVEELRKRKIQIESLHAFRLLFQTDGRERGEGGGEPDGQQPHGADGEKGDRVLETKGLLERQKPTHD